MRSLKLLRGLLLLGLAGWGSVEASDAIVIKGSDTLGAKLIPIMVEEFKAQRPDVSFEIAAEGSTTGIAAIINGNADIGMSSRNITDSEIADAKRKGVEIIQHVVAYDGVAVVVNKANPIDGLRRRQIEQIFTGQVVDWAAVGGEPGRISIYTRNTASGTHSDFKRLVMRRRDYSRTAQVLAGNEQIAAEVADNPNGIGYVGLIYADSPGLKTLAIDGLVLDSLHLPDSNYPLSRPTYLYTKSEPSEIVTEFLEFVKGQVGQRIIRREGFVALR
jgi:phosphate transport system substrate-binding protein